MLKREFFDDKLAELGILGMEQIESHHLVDDLLKELNRLYSECVMRLAPFCPVETVLRAAVDAELRADDGYMELYARRKDAERARAELEAKIERARWELFYALAEDCETNMPVDLAQAELLRWPKKFH